MKSWIAARLDDDARVWHKLWSVRLSLFWAAVSGLWVAVPALQSLLSPDLFGGICVAFALIICLARVYKQPGLVS